MTVDLYRIRLIEYNDSGGKEILETFYTQEEEVATMFKEKSYCEVIEYTEIVRK